MNAFSAAKRTVWITLCLCFLLTAPVAHADQDKSGYLGIMMQDISSSMAKALQMDDRAGVMVTEVVDDSPADKAGLEDGDIILKIQGDDMTSSRDLTRTIRLAEPGQEMELTILRDGKKKTLKIELGEREDKMTWTRETAPLVRELRGRDHAVKLRRMIDSHDENVFVVSNDRGFMGVQLDDISGQMADYFEVKEGKGALITEVNQDSPAAKAGLKAGDVIVAIGDKKVESPSGVHKALADTEPEQEVKVKVIRKGDDKSFKVTLGEAPDDMVMGDYRFFSPDGDFPGHAPKMLYHGKNLPELHEEFEWQENENSLDELRSELKNLQKELDELRKDLNN